MSNPGNPPSFSPDSRYYAGNDPLLAFMAGEAFPSINDLVRHTEDASEYIHTSHGQHGLTGETSLEVESDGMTDPEFAYASDASSDPEFAHVSDVSESISTTGFRTPSPTEDGFGSAESVSSYVRVPGAFQRIDDSARSRSCSRTPTVTNNDSDSESMADVVASSTIELGSNATERTMGPDYVPDVRHGNTNELPFEANPAPGTVNSGSPVSSTLADNGTTSYLPGIQHFIDFLLNRLTTPRPSIALPSLDLPSAFKMPRRPTIPHAPTMPEFPATTARINASEDTSGSEHSSSSHQDVHVGGNPQRQANAPNRNNGYRTRHTTVNISGGTGATHVSVYGSGNVTIIDNGRVSTNSDGSSGEGHEHLRSGPNGLSGDGHPRLSAGATTSSSQGHQPFPAGIEATMGPSGFFTGDGIYMGPGGMFTSDGTSMGPHSITTRDGTSIGPHGIMTSDGTSIGPHGISIPGGISIGPHGIQMGSWGSFSSGFGRRSENGRPRRTRN